jgi:hypothetical protein
MLQTPGRKAPGRLENRLKNRGEKPLFRKIRDVLAEVGAGGGTAWGFHGLAWDMHIKRSFMLLLCGLHSACGLLRPALAPVVARVRTRAVRLLAEEPVGSPASSASSADGPVRSEASGGLGAWMQENMLQGVEPSADTYTIMAVYFVQGVVYYSPSP